MSNRTRLRLMMLLQFMALGSWYPFYPAHLERLGWSGMQIGTFYSMFPLAGMISPLVCGQLADRYVSSERLLALLHFLSGVLFCLMAPLTAYDRLWPLMLLWSLVFAPTMALTNSIAFHHLPEGADGFSEVRVYGTLGWIAVGWLLTAFRQVGPAVGGADCVWLGGMLLFVAAAFDMTLPSTPPTRSASKPLAFLAALSLLGQPRLGLLFLITFVVSTEFMFYYILVVPFLGSLSLSPTSIPAVLTIAQLTEIVAMICLARVTRAFGMKNTIVLGILAWALRYGLFALGRPTWLMVASLLLHGAGFVFFSVAVFIAVDENAMPDIRASAQALVTFTSGLGTYLGSLFVGWVVTLSTETTGVERTVNYLIVFIIPFSLCLACAAILFFGFQRDDESTITPGSVEAGAGVEGVSGGSGA